MSFSSPINKPVLAVILSRFPFPLEKGDKLRAYYQIKDLSKDFDIELICISDIKVSAENLKIYVYVDGRRTEIQPLKGENINYIWISLSPDNSRILFTAAGKGTYICDLKGNVVASLGYLNAPVWFNDRFVVGMQDKDNGQNVTSSDVVMLTADGKLKKQISNPNHIAMYPAASSKANRIVYSTLDGKLVVSELSVN